MADEIIGHKTFIDSHGRFSHEPLYQSEADALLKKVEEEEARRAALMPDEQAAIDMFFDAWLRLKDFGWREASYCPKNGRTFQVIEAGSTGIHLCHYEGEWPTGTYWTHSIGDLWPSRPTLFRELTTTDSPACSPAGSRTAPASPGSDGP